MIAWHVRHGNHVDFHGRRFHVGAGWTAKPAGTGIEIEKGDFTFMPEITGHGNVAVITLTPKFVPGATAEERVEAWRNVARQEYRLIHATQIEVLLKSKSGDISCYRTPPNWLGDLAMSSCLFVEDGWTAEFMGQQNYLDTFFEILRTTDST